MTGKRICSLWIALLFIAAAAAFSAAPAQAQSPDCGSSVTVRFGDTLSAIARRCGTTVREVVAINPWLANRYFLLPGMRIQMPEPPQQQGNVIRYVVRPGDTLLGIARTHNIALADIYRLNPDIDAASMRPGDVVRLPGGIVSPSPPPAAGTVRYTVRPGDTLFTIARLHGLRIADIRRLNPGIEARPLRVGDVILLPGATGTPTPPPSNTVNYTVRPGDTLYAIALAHNMSIGQILQLNPGLNPNRLRVGDVIRLRGGIVPPAPPPPAGVSASISPASGPPGTNVEISASGFTPSTPVKLLAGSTVPNLREFQQLTTDRRGNVTFVARVPAWAAERGTLVFAYETLDGRLRAVTQTFNVTAAAPAPAPSAIQVTGTLTREGAECPAMRGDDGRLYTLAGRNLQDFGPGDRVRVEGRIADMSICMQGTTIEVSRIRAAR